MHFYVMTLFPELITGIASSSILGRAIENDKIQVDAVNFRDYSTDKHKHVDDYPYGGGAGMLIKPEPVMACYEDLVEKIGHSPRVIYLSPKGKTFCDADAVSFAKEEDLIFLCGHYEGIDERALKLMHAEEVSIGDYVLTGGELPAMVLLDAISRKVPGVLSEGSLDNESFSNDLLEYPQYTRPEEFMGERVPEILLSGDHQKVDEWRRKESIKVTYERRPELLNNTVLSKKEKIFLEGLKKDQNNGNLS